MIALMIAMALSADPTAMTAPAVRKEAVTDIQVETRSDGPVLEGVAVTLGCTKVDTSATPSLPPGLEA